MSARTSPLISVVMPVYNQAHFTRKSASSLIFQSEHPHEFIVINNNSTDDTADLLENLKSDAIKRGWKFLIISNSEKLGFGRAMNQGIEAASGAFLALTNNDTWIMPQWDSALLSAIQRLDADMVSPFYDEEPFDELKTPAKARAFVAKNKGKAARRWGSIMMFFKRKFFDEVGKFDERFFICYEDRDLRERADRAHKRYYQVGDCYIWHHSKGTRESGLITSGYEQESLKKFIDKWGFDPRPQEVQWLHKQKRKWTRFKNKFGYF
ncbi:MAG: glycosyltransferase [Oligoflexia bacterium]|nr:glycosyltransferase [Oligoflexia bacterium]